MLVRLLLVYGDVSFRWHLALVLMQNPSLMKYRKFRLPRKDPNFDFGTLADRLNKGVEDAATFTYEHGVATMGHAAEMLKAAAFAEDVAVKERVEADQAEAQAEKEEAEAATARALATQERREAHQAKAAAERKREAAEQAAKSGGAEAEALQEEVRS